MISSSSPVRILRRTTSLPRFERLGSANERKNQAFYVDRRDVKVTTPDDINELVARDKAITGRLPDLRQTWWIRT
jgi:hypothetical protein